MALPLSWSWADVVDQLAAERGSLAELARHLSDVVPESAGLSPDPMTIERGLRRLRGRGNREGNRYGRLILRHLGLPGPIEVWTREMGLYHSRSSDLPVERKRAQLLRWDCPPVSESKAAIWVHIGLASVAHQLGDGAQLEHRMGLARLLAKRASPEPRMEFVLFWALVAYGKGKVEQSERLLVEAEGVLGEMEAGDERACFEARLLDQRAYLCARRDPGNQARLKEAQKLIEAIPVHGAPPFAAFRRAHSLAWSLWKQGEYEEAVEAARLASQHAGDGGLIRFRIMSLGLLAHILGPGQGEGLAALRRAQAMARRLGDARLVGRMERFEVRLHGGQTQGAG